jgi:murein DD-endopeptidase MepM/ murein hydrolase activator NlpD
MPAPEPVQLDAQSLTTSGELGPTATRDSYSVTSWAEMLTLRYGTRSYSYTTTGTGPVRWPFPVQVPISSGFGSRAAPCRGCSSDHQGLDFVPGAGAPIYAIADGTVVLHEEGGGFGNHVILEHTINGQTVRSLYAHMQWGSSALKQGDKISAGDFIGLVGATGQVTGNHLHFELEVDGVNVDPYAWLKTNAS